MLNEGMIHMLMQILNEKDEQLLSKALEMFKFFDRPQFFHFVIIYYTFCLLSFVSSGHFPLMCDFVIPEKYQDEMVKSGLLKRLAELINSDKLTGYRITNKCMSVVSYLLVNHKETIYQQGPSCSPLFDNSYLIIIVDFPFLGIIKSILQMLNETKNVQVQQRALELIDTYQGPLLSFSLFSLFLSSRRFFRHLQFPIILYLSETHEAKILADGMLTALLNLLESNDNKIKTNSLKKLLFYLESTYSFLIDSRSYIFLFCWF